MDSIALFHDNFAQMGGAERVAAALASSLPGAELYTTLAATWKLIPELSARKIRTTWMQHLPAVDRFYRHYFMLYPLAVETVDLQSYDLIVSSCFGYAKGVKKRPDALHVCYCHTPMRWIWRYHNYISREGFGPIQKSLLPLLLRPLRSWDLRASQRPDFYIANSRTVAARIREVYGRESIVIPPPIDIQRFHTSTTRGDYYLVVARLVAYKRIDLAVQACNLLKKRLVIIGDGPDRARLEKMAGPTIEFGGRRSDSDVCRAAAECRGLLFPGEEDFGMTPLEVNASGRPVVAFRAGGAVETVREDETGVFFDHPTPEALGEAIGRMEAHRWSQELLRKHAAAFDRPQFEERIRNFLISLAPSRRLSAALSEKRLAASF